jgi:hypothetical protein
MKLQKIGQILKEPAAYEAGLAAEAGNSSINNQVLTEI